MRRSTVATSVKKQQINHGIVVLAMRHLAAKAFTLLFLSNLKAYFMPPSCISFSREDKNGDDDQRTLRRPTSLRSIRCSVCTQKKQPWVL